jgi:5-dehydro-4-deoxyglucarate dehydratase
LLEFEGVLFFPVTPFSRDDTVATDILESHIATGVDNAAGAVFAACGTGEFHALSTSEYRAALESAVRATNHRVPVVGGTGGPLGHARECAVIAERAGADALLVMPPYLVGAPQQGLIDYIEAIAASTALPLIVYHRGNAQFTAESVTRLFGNPQVIGIKDGAGDVAIAQQFVLAARRAGRDDALFFNGLLTAELSQAAYRSLGIPLYSSAVFAMAPRIANAFYGAYVGEDVAAMRRLLDEFYAPLVLLRDTVPGFAVSLIKAGLRIGGLDVGSVRPPLIDPNPAQLAELERLLAHGNALV